MTTEQPLALKLADGLTDMWGGYEFPGEDFEQQAAAELRRLHAENEAAHQVGIQQEKEIMRLEAENEALREALVLAQQWIVGNVPSDKVAGLATICAALARAGEQT